MARKLRPYEFYHNVAKKIGVSDKKFQYQWENIVEFIIEELQRYNSVMIPNFGEIIAAHRGGKYKHMPVGKNENGVNKTKMVYIKPYLQARFLPTETFKEILNGEKMPKAEIKRMRQEYKKIVEKEKEAERQIEIAKMQKEAIKRENEKRLERIAKYKEIAKKKKKERLELKKEEEKEKYGYGSLKDSDK